MELSRRWRNFHNSTIQDVGGLSKFAPLQVRRSDERVAIGNRQIQILGVLAKTDAGDDGDAGRKYKSGLPIPLIYPDLSFLPAMMEKGPQDRASSPPTMNSQSGSGHGLEAVEVYTRPR
jgi:hypothetical protein